MKSLSLAIIGYLLFFLSVPTCLSAENRDLNRFYAKRNKIPLYEKPDRKSRVILFMKIGKTVEVPKHKILDNNLWIYITVQGPQPTIQKGWINKNDFFSEKDFKLERNFNYRYLKKDFNYWYEEYFFDKQGNVQVQIVTYTKNRERKYNSKRQLYRAGDLFALYGEHLSETLFVYDSKYELICPPRTIGQECKKYLQRFGKKEFITKKTSSESNYH